MSALKFFIFSLFFSKINMSNGVISLGFSALSSVCLLKLPKDMLPSPKKLADMIIWFAVLFQYYGPVLPNACICFDLVSM